MSASRPIIKGILLCDDIRIENTGKHMLIGIYGPEISVARLPSRALFKAAVILDIPEAGDYNFKFQVTDTVDPNIVNTEISVTMFSGGKNIILPAFDFVVDIPKSLTVEIKYLDLDGEWLSVGTWDLSYTSGDEGEQTSDQSSQD